MIAAGQSVREARRRLAAAFAAAGIEEADIDARLLVHHASGADPAHPGAESGGVLEVACAAKLAEFAARRLAREPLARILGHREFHGFDLALNAACLIPRDDTEAVVAAALDVLPRDRPSRVLDLGTGPGTILVAVLAERPLATSVGIDVSGDALAAARANAAAAGFNDRAAFRCGNWTECLEGPFDLIVSNPPYIPTADCEGLEPEVRLHDPRRALDGGVDGLDAYRAILADAPRLLAPGGSIVLELGIGQAHPVAGIGRQAGLSIKALRSDLGGVPRALVLVR